MKTKRTSLATYKAHFRRLLDGDSAPSESHPAAKAGKKSEAFLKREGLLNRRGHVVSGTTAEQRAAIHWFKNQM